jgi:hypothetical protein
VAVIRTAGPSLEGIVTGIDADGFDLETAQGRARIGWDEVSSAFGMRRAA